MRQGVDRRRFLGLAGTGAGALILGGVPVGAGAARRRGVPLARSGSFPQGIASGEPEPDGITLWTRLGGHTQDRKLTLEVAGDPEFGNVVYRRNVIARAAKDHTIGVRLERKPFLRPGERYWYRFATREAESQVGRFRTLRPPDSREPVRIAFFSCQDREAGYYGAHTTIAEVDDLDLVLCLGDYIYERHYYDGPADRKDTLGANGDGEVQTLPEYRQKYQLYKQDEDLQALHAAHPYMGIWDDHEIEDNYAGEQPGDVTIDPRVPFVERRANGYQAFYEYMPFRRVRGLGDRLYRKLSLGRTAELFLTDQRQYRDDQPCGDALFAPCPEAEEPGRTYLGQGQREWLKDGLARSRASWKVIASQLMMMSLDIVPGGSVGAINKDGWDGYGDERREVLEHVQRNGVKGVAVLTGDIHTFFAGDVGVNGRGPGSVATEFVGGSITSLGIPEQFAETGLPIEVARGLAGNIRTLNPHVRFADFEHRGYGLLVADPNELQVEFKAVEAARRRSTTSRTIGRFRVERNRARVEVL